MCAGTRNSANISAATRTPRGLAYRLPDARRTPSRPRPRRFALRTLARLPLAEQDTANEGGAGLARQTPLVCPGPVGDLRRLEQMGGHFCGGQLAPRSAARLLATSGRGDD